MTELFASGRIVDLILALMMLEGALLLAYRLRTGRGLAPADLAVNLLAGACLLLALRGALVGAGWGWIAICLAAALPAHLADLRRRFSSVSRDAAADGHVGHQSPRQRRDFSRRSSLTPDSEIAPSKT